MRRGLRDTCTPRKATTSGAPRAPQHSPKTPQFGLRWPPAGAALVGIDAAPKVRKNLLEVLRCRPPPHDLDGPCHAFADHDPAARVAAARTAGFTRDGAALYTELVTGTLDEGWDMRVAAVQPLGQLKIAGAMTRLVRMLADEVPAVRRQVLIALDRIDPEGARRLPGLERLARDRQHWKIAALATSLLRERPPTNGAAGAGTGSQTGAP